VTPNHADQPPAALASPGANTQELPPLDPLANAQQPIKGKTQPAPATPTKTLTAQQTRELVAQARKQIDDGQSAQAIQLIEAALPRVPSISKAAVQAVLADALVAEGNAAIKAERVAEAIAAYRRATELAPNTARNHLYLGNALYHDAVRLKAEGGRSLDRFKEAAKAVEQAVKLSPKDYVAHHRLAMIYQELGRHRDARSSWQAVLRNAPPDSVSAIAADKALKALSPKG
jgi:tetratricopeptide (TPR) repeat protein